MESNGILRAAKSRQDANEPRKTRGDLKFFRKILKPENGLRKGRRRLFWKQVVFKILSYLTVIFYGFLPG